MDIAHYPVLKEEVFSYLRPKDESGLLIDATLGEGGHAHMFLERYPALQVVGVDADNRIMQVARERLAPYGNRMRFFHTWFNVFFRDYPLGDERPDLILFDLGISVFHYEKGERGFSFRKDENLDMRLGEELEITAFDMVNEYPEEELADIFFRFGEEGYSRRIAAAIVRAREEAPILTTGRLAEIIRGAVPMKYRTGRLHPATRTFQALRIAVNGELARLEGVLEHAFSVLKPGGRIGIIAFHSLEDRIVKWFFREKQKPCTCPPEWPICKCGGIPKADILTKKPVRPGEEEVRLNPPSRSARLRVLEKREDEDFS
ncbi:MAG: 16S rRNA (cytosine(1402)-N(4))-methyltransferase RsmH [Spirochaetales bacterium]|nr:16S rRNA (cytosine(1402)-N(4))-methyltransferase RsmH [Spirochaetales bacterium]